MRAHSRDLLAQVGRRRRKLEREVGPVVCEWQSSQPEDDMARLEQWKSDQYARDGHVGPLRRSRGSPAPSAGCAESRDPACTGVLTVLRAGDRLVAAHFGLLGPDRLSWWFPAYDPEFGRYSPGLILLLSLISEAAERAVPVIDLGRGEHGYKLRVTPHFYEVAEGCVDAGPPPRLGAMPARTLMAIHAHPDDEVISTGGVLARYADEGVRTVVVTCTDGSQGFGPGRVLPGEPGHDRDAVAKVRKAELERSCAALGVGHLEMLGYRDSGMAGWAGNQ